MANTSTITKTRKDLEKTITEATPLYAVVGAGDLAVERLREARAELNSAAAKLDPRTAPKRVLALPGRATNAIGGAVATAVNTYGDLAGRGKNLVTRVRKQDETSALQGQAQTAVRSAKAATTTAAKSAAATKTAAKRTTTTAKRTASDAASTVGTSARRTTVTAKKSASDAASKVGTSAKGTTTTAKKSASRTQTAAKSAATSTRKTAKAAKKAADATSAKVGDPRNDKTDKP